MFFFLKIKGFGNDKLIKEEILRISTLVGLNNELSKRAEALSGGMSRRLSVAMALVGDSKVILRFYEIFLKQNKIFNFQKIRLLSSMSPRQASIHQIEGIKNDRRFLK